MDIGIYLTIVGNFEKSYDVFRRMCKAHIMHKCVYTHARPTPWAGTTDIESIVQSFPVVLAPSGNVAKP